ncbi:BBT_HP_G0011030.mRNA.1.CDS.1 [Saccharomyces cerevisiae]|nr:BBT_HP_G0053860.mRNA.1.CDS.1 [Saccharomyces cerevisiae]CAI4990556.1 BBT_HP_G0071950.mRNA.1.CDS.1 [Saccharomyces cerevisiae]CAI5206610.1 BBT_HP_G0011030.mRNA.1.CDS.1 [Saccharomyces cerevisiae]CAI6696709.1 BBT_HP_G0053860.mRNA.1.CDS.1 [Saccharomyces cerevisiae]CAI6857862.1 BBT_HP_G0071950.mRNA.1.CDS.1 [Saccharomyces cerevisiae]
MAIQKVSNKDLSRKDKRRFNIESKVNKIYQNFYSERDNQYKDRLTALQTDLTSLHQGDNGQYARQVRDLEEERDLELVRLRLFEEYRVSRSGIEFQEDIEKAKAEHEKLIKLCKERLYSSIEQKIKKLQEERLLIDVANVHSYAMNYSRPQYQKNTRSHTVSGWDSSSNEYGRDTANESATDTGAGNDRRTLRRRNASKDTRGNNNNQDESDFQTGNGSGSNGHGSRQGSQFPHFNNLTYKSGMNSDSDFLQGINEGTDLYAFLFGEKNPKDNANGNEKKKNRGAQRYSTKTAPPLQSLKPDEVTEDISLIRELTGQPPAPFRLRSD